MPKNTPYSDEERIAAFWDKVDKSGECWVWTGGKTLKGYGQAYLGPTRNSPRKRVHTVSWTLIRGPVPEGLTLDHLCRNKLCVNPDHLELVTAEENTRRANSFRVLPDSCPKGHPFVEENTYHPVRKNKDGTTYTTRACKACQQEVSRRAYVRKKALNCSDAE